jgi:hypothetical protein
MHSNDIALQFYNQGRANKWLSAKQTSWLYGQACREADRHLTTHGTPTANGVFTLASGEVIGWEIAVSSINGCAIFRTHSVTALVEQQNAEREATLDRGRQFCQLLREHPEMSDLYPLEVITRMFKVSLEQAQEWLKEEKQ